MSPDNFAQISWLVIKILAIIGLTLYAIFAGIMVRQEQLMAKVLETNTEPVLRTLTVIHFVASVIVVLLGIILL